MAVSDMLVQVSDDIRRPDFLNPLTIDCFSYLHCRPPEYASSVFGSVPQPDLITFPAGYGVIGDHTPIVP